MNTPSNMTGQRFLEGVVKVSYILYEDGSKGFLFDERGNPKTPNGYKPYVGKSEKKIAKVLTEIVKGEKLLLLQKINARLITAVIDYKLKLN